MLLNDDSECCSWMLFVNAVWKLSKANAPLCTMDISPTEAYWSSSHTLSYNMPNQWRLIISNNHFQLAESTPPEVHLSGSKVFLF